MVKFFKINGKRKYKTMNRKNFPTKKKFVQIKSLVKMKWKNF
jgi:hypothetical protein